MTYYALILTALAALVDIRKREIPNGIPLLLIAGGCAGAWLALDAVPAAHRGLGLLVGLLAGLPFFRADVLGGGDVKLMAGLGAALGLPALAVVLLFAAIAGGGLALIARFRGEREVAYAPAFALGLAAFLATGGQEAIDGTR
jgi:Flp pilus assembly protein protease CpaA